MKKILLTCAAAGLVLSACTTTQVRETTNKFEAPSEKTSTMMFTPDVEMSALLASGVAEPRADWSEAAKANLKTALQAQLNDRASKVYFMDDDVNLTEKQIQLLKLKDAVLKANTQYAMLKNKKDTFDLTLGPDAAALSMDTNSEFALLTSARGSFQTAGKIAVNAALMVLSAYTGGTASIQTGSQAATVSLVDLSTGDIVWTNTTSLGAGADLRKEEGAVRVAETLLKEFPLK